MAILEALKKLFEKKIIIVLVLIIILLTAIIFIPGRKTSKPINLPSPNPVFPSVMPSIIPDKTGKGDPGYQEEIETKLNKRFPLFPYLPYQTEDFSIKYSGPLSLEVTLKTASESAKSQALDWIRSKGVDPQSHKIIFK